MIGMSEFLVVLFVCLNVKPTQKWNPCHHDIFFNMLTEVIHHQNAQTIYCIHHNLAEASKVPLWEDFQHQTKNHLLRNLNIKYRGNKVRANINVDSILILVLNAVPSQNPLHRYYGKRMLILGHSLQASIRYFT